MPRKLVRQLAKPSASKTDRNGARLRSEQATSKFRTALRDYQIVQTTHSTTHAPKPWAVLDVARDVIVARFDDVSDAAQFVATA
mgnify:CR=1 FL=1